MLIFKVHYCFFVIYRNCFIHYIYDVNITILIRYRNTIHLLFTIYDHIRFTYIHSVRKLQLLNFLYLHLVICNFKGKLRGLNIIFTIRKV